MSGNLDRGRTSPTRTAMSCRPLGVECSHLWEKYVPDGERSPRSARLRVPRVRPAPPRRRRPSETPDEGLRASAGQDPVERHYLLNRGQGIIRTLGPAEVDDDGTRVALGQLPSGSRWPSGSSPVPPAASLTSFCRAPVQVPWLTRSSRAASSDTDGDAGVERAMSPAIPEAHDEHIALVPQTGGLLNQSAELQDRRVDVKRVDEKAAERLRIVVGEAA